MFNTPFALLASAGYVTCVDIYSTPGCYIGCAGWYCRPGTCQVDVLVVAGGGGGGGGRKITSPCNAGGGGGGAGGVSILTLCGANIPNTALGSIGVCVGYGGPNGVGWLAGLSPPLNYNGQSGDQSIWGIPGTYAYPLVASGGAGGRGSQATALGGAGGVGNMGTSPAGGRGGSWLCGYGPDPGGSCAGFPGGGGGAPALPLNGFQSSNGMPGGAGSTTCCGLVLGSGGTGGRSIYDTSGTVGFGLQSGQNYGGGGGGGGGGCTISGTPNYDGSNGAQGIVVVYSCVAL